MVRTLDFTANEMSKYWRVLLLLLLFLFILRAKERACAYKWGRGRERGRESPAGFPAVIAEPNTGLGLMTVRS